VYDIPAVMQGGLSPPIWTVGVGVIALVLMVVEYLQDGGLQPFESNPGYGPCDSTMLQFGAKLGTVIIDGDWWRIFSAVFVQNGFLTLAITVAVGFFVREVERTSGFWRSCMLFNIAGSYGYILSSLFIPRVLTCGTTGAEMGLLGLLLCDLVSSWRGVKTAVRDLVLYVGLIALLVIIGFSPYVDNWAHLGGLVMGLLFALMLLPNFQFKGCSMVLRGVFAFLAFPMMATIFMLSLVVLLRRIGAADKWCSNCNGFNVVCLYKWCDKDSIA
jgi:membrane associated rhomboid family serine protease